MKKRILIIDDEPAILLMTASRLRAHGYDVLTASNGEEGLQSLSDNAPDLILVDFMMPPPTGFEVCQRIKSSTSSKDIPTLLFTAKSSQSEVDEAMKCGADDVILKPYTPESLLKKIEDYLPNDQNLDNR